MQKIYLVTDIDNESFRLFSKKLSKLERDKVQQIRVVLSSYGGDALSALAFYDRIRLSPIYVEITATGLVASAAVLVLAAGHYRRMTKNAWVMVHDDTPHPTEVKNKRLVEVEKTAAHYRRLETQWNGILAETTKTDIPTWDRLHREETYLNPEECLALGLIEEII